MIIVPCTGMPGENIANNWRFWLRRQHSAILLDLDLAARLSCDSCTNATVKQEFSQFTPVERIPGAQLLPS